MIGTHIKMENVRMTHSGYQCGMIMMTGKLKFSYSVKCTILSRNFIIKQFFF